MIILGLDPGLHALHQPQEDPAHSRLVEVVP